jgi:carbamoyltransferase
MKKRYYIGLSSSFHDPSIAIVNPDGEVVFAEATERYLQNKRAWNCPADDLLRMPALIEAYCEPDAELVCAHTWSESFLTNLRMLLPGAMSALGPFRKAGELMLDFQAQFIDHWPIPDTKYMTAMLRATIEQAGVALAANPAVKNPVVSRRYNHHLTHASYGCYSSPFDEAVCAVIDGRGEFASTGFYVYRGGAIEPIPRGRFPMESGSLGFFYAMICNACGFDWLKGEEWKVMGLAPYGRLDDEFYALLKPLLQVRDLTLVPGVSFRERKRILERMRALLPRRGPPIEAANLAYTGQQLFNEAMRTILQNLAARGLSRNLVLTGGCALNSSCNGRLLEETSFESLHVPSAPADDGNSVGAALLAYYEDHPERRRPRRLMSPYLGTDVSSETREFLLQFNTSHRVRHLPDGVVAATARLLAEGKIVGWMQGRAEFGPRALGHRSILADARLPEMKDKINARVKFREEYRPFAPSILHEFGPEYFENYQMSPYMDRTLVFREAVRHKVPAVVHVDNSSRLQSVTPELSEKYYRLIRAFYDLTGVPLILNTSFNIMGKPIIHSIQDAIGMFYTCGLDALVIDDVLIEREAGPPS